jgi:hypothetical protein
MKTKSAPMFKVKPMPVKTPKFQGKGTRARLNTAASKTFFGSKISK